MNQETFLARVRSSLGGVTRAAEAMKPQPHTASERELADRLAGELEAVGGVVHRAGSLAKASEHIVDILRAAKARRIARTRAVLLDELDLDRTLFEAGIEWTVCDLRDDTSREAIREADFAADAGLTAADYGVAETGSLVLVSRPGEGRAVSLVPPIHIAVLRARDIVHELGALFKRVDAQEPSLPSALTFITGPSSTGDIELVLTVGVHGPRELHLVLLG